MHHKFLLLARIFIVALLVAGGLASPPSAAKAATGATLTVNSTSDADSGVDGVCTLREAMKAAVGDADYHECTNSGDPYGDDYIGFSVGGTTVTLGSSLPSVSSGSITINGYNSGSPITIDGASLYRPFDVWPGTTLTLGNLTIQDGAASIGGGALNRGVLIVLNSTFLNNSAVDDGGAINNQGGGQLTVSNSTFSGNTANYGGGLLNNNGTATILNSTFSGNGATSNGGGLGTWSTSVTNTYNTILANSTSGEDCWNGLAGTLSGSNNIIETTSPGLPDCSSIATSTADPQLDSLTGSPAYFPLLGGSPAIDTGDPTTCSSAPIYNASQNGVARPQGPACDISSFELPQNRRTLKSIAARDGWVLESSEFSEVGGTSNSTDTTFRLGDESLDQQYRSILSFGTSSLPDTAVITSLKLKIRQAGATGTNPFDTLGMIKLDIRRGAFGGSVDLQPVDFEAAPHKSNAASISNSPSGGWYTKNLASSNFDYINLTGMTQFRLRFATGDNNSMSPDYLTFHSGEAASSSQPRLVITYYVP